MIRMATTQDIPAILEIYGPYVQNTTCSFEYQVPDMETFLQRFQTITKQFPWLVWEEGGQVLGYAYGSLPFSRSAYQWCCEVSIYIAPQGQKKGIGRKLYAVLEALLWQQGYQVIYSLVTSENENSLAFHYHMGYRLVAELPGCGVKHGKRLGVTWLEKRQETDTLPTKPPVSWRDIVENNEKLTNILDTLSLS